MPDNAVLKTSVGGTLSSTLSYKTTHQIVKKGDAAPDTTGLFDTVTLLNPTLDTAYTDATLGSPILLGVDDVMFKPLQYPELVGE